MWKDNFFVTLTYNDEFLPPYGSLSLRDFQLFMKRLRKAKNSSSVNPVRFFMGAEYGDYNFRPHYHVLLFNCGFSDLKCWSKNARGEQLYISDELSKLWSVDGQSMGFCTLGEVTFDSAVYCAKYSLKKLTISDNSPPEIIKRFEEKYLVVDEAGEVHQRELEFSCKSLRPGIGGAYYEKYGAEVRAHDSVVIEGREVKPPRFYDTRTEFISPERFAQLKRKRKRLSVLNRADNTSERLRVKQRLMEIAAEKKERKL